VILAIIVVVEDFAFISAGSSWPGMMMMNDMRLKGKKIAILTSEMYEDLELWYPYFRMMEEGADIEVVSMIDSPLEILSRHCYPLKTDKSAKEARPEDYDALIIPGGFAPEMLRRSEDVLRFVTAMFNQKKLVAAKCHGLLVLASAGLLFGKKATAKNDLQQEIARQSRTDQGIRWQDQDVVVDGNLITSRTKWALPMFCKEIIGALTKK
jgi:protease I